MDGFSRSIATIKPVLLPAISRAAPFFRVAAPLRRSARSDPGAIEFSAAPGERAHPVPSLHERADASLLRRPMHVIVAHQQTKTAGSELPRDTGAQVKPVQQQRCTALKQFSASPPGAKDPTSANEITFF